MKSTLIITPNTLLDLKKNHFSVMTGIDKPQIIRGILYYDNISFINSFIIDLSLKDNIDYNVLYREGIASDINVEFEGYGDMAKCAYDSVYKKVISLVSSIDGNYSTYNLDEIYKNEDDDFYAHGGSVVSLINALPEPAIDVTIDEILEFRLKRGDMLNHLINHIQSLGIRVSSSENKVQELRACINEVDSACLDITRVYNESGIKFNLSSLKFNFSVKDIVETTALTYGGASMFLPQTGAIISGIAAGVGTMVEIKDAISFRRIDKKNPFNYVGEVTKRLC